IEKITGFSKTQRLINKEIALSIVQQQQLQNFSEQLLQSKPVQYVLQEAWFAGMNFFVDENVLIPRPETEELVEYIIHDLQFPVHDLQLTILDIGTGSGCIAIALKKKLLLSNVFALDISEKSIQIAEKNAEKNNVSVSFFQADILNPDPKINFPVFDIIVSNPPYIKKTEANGMSPNVLHYEPHIALFVSDSDPLIFYKTIADFALTHLNNEGELFFEINEMMSKQITGLLKDKGFSEIVIKKDFQEKDRIASAVLRKMK
ncbi:MAG TPA: peptide chain release factor N(5)-glutamine methyltransferase, partial [Parafilimonas sp.]